MLKIAREEKRRKVNVLILLTSLPSPVLQPHMNTNLHILQPDSSEVDLGHRNHQGSDGFGCLSLFCVWLSLVYSNIQRYICFKRMVFMKRPTVKILCLIKSASEKDGKYPVFLSTDK